MTPEVREWNADTYHRVSGPQATWSQAVIERLELQGSETVLDAGCGSGRVTADLVAAVPDGKVIAVDASEDMCRKAREELGPEADVRVADLAEFKLEPGEALVDAIFSNAVFHWVPDHEALFAAMAAALRPGGRFSAQCGGEGNIANVHAAAQWAAQQAGLTERFADWAAPWNFAPAWQSEERLHLAGFVIAKAWVQPWPVRPDEPRAFLETVCLGPYLEQLPEDEHTVFVDKVLERLGSDPVLEYVRLNLTGIRADD